MSGGGELDDEKAESVSDPVMRAGTQSVKEMSSEVGYSLSLTYSSYSCILVFFESSRYQPFWSDDHDDGT